MHRVIILVGFLTAALAAAMLPTGQVSEAQPGCFPETGFCIRNPAFLDYFNTRGGTRSFGPPISTEFTFLGFRVQFFQGHIMQLMPDGRVATMNLLQEGLMPATRVNTSTFPPNDAGIQASTPQVGEAGYADRVVEFMRQNAPNQFNNRPVRFFDTFMSTVDLATAFPGGGGNPSLLPLLNLEIWGVVTSRPAADPANAGFIYQRTQRSIMHYQESCQCTERILLALWFKTVITGDGLPADLAGDMANSPYIRQYSPGSPGWLARPAALPNTDMTNAFTPDLGGPGPSIPPPAPPGPATPTATPVPSDALPSVTIQLSDDRVDPGQTITITVIATDDMGVDRLMWEEVDGDDTPDDPALDAEQRFDCDRLTQCAHDWQVTVTVPGTHFIEGRARDTAGQIALSTRIELRVRPGPTPTPTSTPGPDSPGIIPGPGIVGPTATPTPSPTPTWTPGPTTPL